MSKNRKKLKHALALVLVNLVAIVILLYLCELYLLFTDPARGLPVDGFVGGRFLTWGHEVVHNSHGFRERQFAVPKPAGVFRVMVLGDSFTWGAGLAVEQRYTNLLEGMLRERYPGRDIEVLNFGTPGGPTVKERDILASLAEKVSPDVVVVGFCLNDTQPRSQHYSAEREQFERRHGGWINGTFGVLSGMGLPRMAKVFHRAVYRCAEGGGRIPSWQQALQRTYEKDSPEWVAFEGALGDISEICSRMGLSAPIFAVLNQGTRTNGPTDYGNPDEELKLYLKWYRQAEQAAKEAGFVTCSFEKEIETEFADESLAVNIVDVHPSARLNGLYARKIFELTAPLVEQGR